MMVLSWWFCAQCDFQLRDYVSEQITALLSDRIFINALEGYLPGDAASQARVPLLQERLHALAPAER